MKTFIVFMYYCSWACTDDQSYTDVNGLTCTDYGASEHGCLSAFDYYEAVDKCCVSCETGIFFLFVLTAGRCHVMISFPCRKW